MAPPTPLFELLVRLFELGLSTTRIAGCHVRYLIDRRTGELTKLGQARTGGRHVAFATTSTDGSGIAVCHKQDGRLVFFDCAANNGVLETPVAVIDTPEVKPFTRTTEGLAPLPSLQHCA